MIKSKKGVQPLIATVLLILLAGALGIVVMNFGRAQIEIAAQCGVDIGLDTVIIDDQEQVCVNSADNNLFVILENGPNIDVFSLQLRAIGSKSVVSQELVDSSIAASDAKIINFPYDVNGFGEIRQLRITPQVELYQDVVSCGQQAITIENVPEC